MKYIFIFSFFLASFCAFSQPLISYEEKLEEIITQADDTLKAEALYNQGFSIRVSNPFLAFDYARQTLKCANNLHSQKYIAKAFSLMGVLFYRKGDYVNAQLLSERALKIRIELKDEIACAHSYTNIGNIYSNIGNFVLSAKNHLMALSIFSKFNDTKQIMNCLINLGVLNKLELKIEAANENLKKALLIAEQLNDYEGMATCYSNLGVICEEEKNYQLALDYYFETIRLRELMCNNSEIADSYYNIAMVYGAMNNEEEELCWLQKSIAFAKSCNYLQAQKDVLEEMASVFASQKKYDKAFECLQQKLILDKSTESFDFDEKKTLAFPIQEFENVNEKKTDYSNFYLLIITILCGLLFIIIFFNSKKNNLNGQEEK